MKHPLKWRQPQNEEEDLKNEKWLSILQKLAILEDNLKNYETKNYENIKNENDPPKMREWIPLSNQYPHQFLSPLPLKDEYPF